MDRTNIEWTDSTWNPVTGCTKVSPGCDHCYAETLAERFRGTADHYYENGFDVRLRPEKLDQPLRWTRPRRIFVNSMSDLFHDDIPDDYVAQVFAVMALAPQHTFQLLTKRHGRMRSLLSQSPGGPGDSFVQRVKHHMWAKAGGDKSAMPGWHHRIDQQHEWWPLHNVWLGVSVENQQWADIRIPALSVTPAAVRFLSMEPLLGPVDLSPLLHGTERCATCDGSGSVAVPGGGAACPTCDYENRISTGRQNVDWVIVGGESGRGARPMHPAWVQTLRDQCLAAGVAFHFKQWGEWAPRGRLRDGDLLPVDNDRTLIFNEAGNRRGRAAGSLSNQLAEFSDRTWCEVMERVGKKAAGRDFQGRTWDGFPDQEQP